MAPPAPEPPPGGVTSPLDLTGGSGTAPLGELQLAPVHNDSAEVLAARETVEGLTQEANAAIERFNAAAERAKVVEVELTSAEARLAAAQEVLDAASEQLGVVVSSMYRSGAVPPEVSAFLGSGASDPADFVHGISVVSVVGDRRAVVVETARSARKEMESAREEVAARLDEERTLVARMADERATVDARLDASQSLLASLEGGSGYAIYSLTDLPPYVSAQGTGGEVAPLGKRTPPDFIVHDLTPQTLAAAKDLAPVSAPLMAGVVTVGGVSTTAVSADPSVLRAFAKPAASESDALWQGVARGEAVVSHRLAADRGLTLGGPVTLQPAQGEPLTLRVTGFATLGVPGAEVVLSPVAAAPLGLVDEKLLVSADGGDKAALSRALGALPGARVEALSGGPSSIAFLSGNEAARAFGTFSYTYTSDGSIRPDPAWVRANIRTEQLPILGRVTGHRLMLPQLRSVLSQIEAEGLEGEIRTFDGTYVPRFIARDPSRGISLHTWGIAIDLNASTNYRGIRGDMHPRVVEIFKSWGFRWGGDWRYTDPMHFELGAIAQPST